MVQKRETKAINKLCAREILSLSFVCGACFFEFRGRNLVCFGIAYKFVGGGAGKFAPILVPRGRAPFGQHQESRPLASTSGLVKHRKSAIHGPPVTLRMFRVKSDKSDWFWSQSIVFSKPFKNGMLLDRARGSTAVK